MAAGKGMTMGIDMDQALALVKARLNRLPNDTQLDAYLRARLEAAKKEIEKNGIRLQDDLCDTMLLVDKTVFDYQSRDKQQGQPDWLRARLRNRWLHHDTQ